MVFEVRRWLVVLDHAALVGLKWGRRNSSGFQPNIWDQFGFASSSIIVAQIPDYLMHDERTYW